VISAKIGLKVEQKKNSAEAIKQIIIIKYIE